MKNGSLRIPIRGFRFEDSDSRIPMLTTEHVWGWNPRATVQTSPLAHTLAQPGPKSRAHVPGCVSPPPTHTHAHTTDTHTGKYTHTHTHTQTETHTHTHTPTLSLTHTQTHTHTYIHRQTHVHTANDGVHVCVWERVG
jgi:hypothetical protein